MPHGMEWPEARWQALSVDARHQVVYICFNNSALGCAMENARDLSAILAETNPHR